MPRFGIIGASGLLALVLGVSAAAHRPEPGESGDSVQSVLVRGAVLDEVTAGPVPGAIVQIGDLTTVATTRTDQAGEYRLASVPVGLVRVLVMKDRVGQTTLDTVLSGDTHVTVVLERFRFTLRGRVQDACQDGVPAARIVVLNGENRGRAAETGDTAAYELDDLITGSFTIRATAVGYRPVDRRVEFRTGEPIAVEDLVLPRDTAGCADMRQVG